MIICLALFKVKSQSILLLFSSKKKKIKCTYKHDHTQLLLLHTKKSKENGPQLATDSHLKLPCHVGFCRCVVDCAII